MIQTQYFKSQVVTETVLSEIKLQTEEVRSCSSTDVNSLLDAPTIATNIDQLRRDILHKKAEIEQLKVEKLNTPIIFNILYKKLMGICFFSLIRDLQILVT